LGHRKRREKVGRERERKRGKEGRRRESQEREREKERAGAFLSLLMVSSGEALSIHLRRPQEEEFSDISVVRYCKCLNNFSSFLS